MTTGCKGPRSMVSLWSYQAEAAGHHCMRHVTCLSTRRTFCTSTRARHAPPVTLYFCFIPSGRHILDPSQRFDILYRARSIAYLIWLGALQLAVCGRTARPAQYVWRRCSTSLMILTMSCLSLLLDAVSYFSHCQSHCTGWRELTVRPCVPRILPASMVRQPSLQLYRRYASPGLTRILAYSKRSSGRVPDMSARMLYGREQQVRDDAAVYQLGRARRELSGGVESCQTAYAKGSPGAK